MLIYAVLVNLIGLISMYIDKRRARRGRRRIRENTLYLIGLVGGIGGIIAGMVAFHHKTRKPGFILIAMAILFIHLVLLLFFFKVRIPDMINLFS
jgi:uncharacterized membrane protein YsdA (DUF1294 family)